jgi:1-acyl-sn-glycerol-3-phosphate acyltransferase
MRTHAVCGVNLCRVNGHPLWIPSAVRAIFRAMARRILSVFVWTAVGIICLVWVVLMSVIFALTAWRDPGRYRVGRWFRRAAVMATKVNPLWDFRTSGVVIRDPRRPYVAVANHESFADIFLISHLPWEMKWLSKEAIFRIPVMGWMMRMAGDIAVRRDQASSRSKALEDCRDRLAKGVSVVILPEGTRSRDGTLLPFQPGAFLLAVDLGLPILPMVVAGTAEALPKGSLVFGRSRAEVRVLEPIETAGMTRADVRALRDQVWERMNEAKQQLRAELATPERLTSTERERA